MAGWAARKRLFKRAKFLPIYPLEDTLFILESKPREYYLNSTGYMHHHKCSPLRFVKQCFAFGRGYARLNKILGNKRYALRKTIQLVLMIPLILSGLVTLYHRKRILSILNKKGVVMALMSTLLYHIQFVFGTLGAVYGWIRK